MTSLSPTETKEDRRFRRLALGSVISLYLVILAGGIVRSTGAGMGCPDWPKCFGSWIPPTEVSQLPLNYKEIYGAKLKGEVLFNPVKTWIEYANRLTGAVTGIVLFYTLLLSLRYRKSSNRSLFSWTLAAFLLTCFQGWIGAKVVSFELLPVMVTIHMFLAIVIVFIMLYVLAKAYSMGTPLVSLSNSKKVTGTLLFLIALTFFQVMLGTQVREEMDVVIGRLGYDNRADWIAELGIGFYIHRSFSVLVLVASVVLGVQTLSNSGGIIKRLVYWVFYLTAIVIASGIAMAYFGVPTFSQPVHLTFAIALIGVQFLVLLLVNSERMLARR
jgi:cytochrome c oxidase assembly protein subunit 15